MTLQNCNGTAPESDSAVSSDEVTQSSFTATPSDGSINGVRHRSASDSGRKTSTPSAGHRRKGSDPNEVYDSLVSESSRTARLRDGIAKMMPKRSGNLNLEERKQNAHERLNRQFSLSDMHEG